MKILLIILFHLSFVCLNAQKITNYNTKIDTATRVEIENGIINIKKADTVIIKVFISQNNSQVFIDSFSQIRDTSGIYITTIQFKSNKLFSFDFELLFFFNKPIEEMELKMVGNGSAQTKGGSSADKKVYGFSGNTTAKRLAAIIRSKEKILITIKGAEGVSRD